MACCHQTLPLSTVFTHCTVHIYNLHCMYILYIRTIHMYVYMYMYMHTYVCILCIYIHMYVCMYLNNMPLVHTHIYTCMCVSLVHRQVITV